MSKDGHEEKLGQIPPPLLALVLSLITTKAVNPIKWFSNCAPGHPSIPRKYLRCHWGW